MLNVNDPYSYRQNPEIPSFPEDKALFIFDGICVLCSTGCAWMMRHDSKDQFHFTTTATPLGKALFGHYGIDVDKTYMLIDKGRMYTKSDGYLHMLDQLGGWWPLLKVFYLMPRGIRDFLYDVMNRNRYRWFGKTGYCELIPEQFKQKML
ncbi:MAG TPA: DCC1-like thiol-disulfide oxidoreductase family protein [Alphaproteobacteria bacterium]|nr:DCC1-like thiol-disulfide oxidoreductase family protein [Alphaproteobacteria bacterium]